jgi:hypothetical protein
MHVAHVYARLAKRAAAEESSEAHHRERGQSIEERVLKGMFSSCAIDVRIKRYARFDKHTARPCYWTARFIMAAAPVWISPDAASAMGPARKPPKLRLDA